MSVAGFSTHRRRNGPAARAGCKPTAANSRREPGSTVAMKKRFTHCGPRRMRGFSLIEMVAAFLVFAIGMGVLMGILTTSMRSARMSSDYTMAALWAQSKLDTVGVGEPVEEGGSSGSFDDNYAWQLEVHRVDPAAVEPPPQAAPARGNGQGGMKQDTAGERVSIANAGLGGGIDTAPFDLYQLDLTVTWGGQRGGNQHHAQFNTLRAVNPDPDNPQGVSRVPFNGRGREVK